MKNNTIVYALLASILAQAPLGYLFISLEGLVLGQGFIGFPSGIYYYLVGAILISTIIIIVVGLPIYFALKRFGSNTSLLVSAIGFLIPVLILCVINFSISSYEGYSAGENYYGTYRSTIESGERTVWGWVKVLEDMITYGIHGVLGSMIFHKIYTGGKKA